MKRIIVFFIGLGYSLGCPAQGKLDSLFKELSKHTSQDSTQVELFSLVAKTSSSSNPGLAIRYYEKAVKIAPLHVSQNYLANLYLKLAQLQWFQGDLELAMKNCLAADKIYLAGKDANGHYEVCSSITNFYLNAGNVEKAIESFTNEANAFSKVDDKNHAINYYINQASVLFMSSDTKYDSVIYYYKKALQYAEEQNDVLEQQTIYGNLGACMYQMKMYDSVEYYIRKSFNLSMHHEHGESMKAMCYSYLGDASAAQKDYKKAKVFYDSSLLIAAKTNANDALIGSYASLANMYETMGDYKTFSSYILKYYQTKDSLYGIKQQNVLNQLENSYAQELNEKEIQEEKRKKMASLILSAILVLGSIGLIYSMLKIKRSKRLLLQQKLAIEEQKNEISLQKDELVQLNNTKDKLFSVISHDLRNPLVTLSNYLDAGNDAPIDKPTLEKNKAAVANSLQHSISLLDNLLTWAYSQLNTHQPLVNRIDMKDWLDEVRAVIEPQAMQKRIHISTEIKENADNFIGDENMLSIVMRNVLTNAIKFSSAGDQIEIFAQPFESKIQLSITDHGIGIDPEKLEAIKQRRIASTTGTANEKGSGLGLNIVMDLLQKLNIAWDLKSTINQGTTFTLLLPVS